MIGLRWIGSSIDRSVPLPHVLVTTLLGVALGIAVAAIGPIYVLAGIVGAAVAVGALVGTQFSLLAFVAVATLLPFAVIPVALSPWGWALHVRIPTGGRLPGARAAIADRQDELHG